MPNSTLLSLFQTSLQGLGVAASGAPTTVYGNTNQDIVQTLALVNAAGGDLNREHDWQQAQVKSIFEADYFERTGTTAVVVPFPVPSSQVSSSCTCPSLLK